MKISKKRLDDKISYKKIYNTYITHWLSNRALIKYDAAGFLDPDGGPLCGLCFTPMDSEDFQKIKDSLKECKKSFNFSTYEFWFKSRFDRMHYLLLLAAENNEL